MKRWDSSHDGAIYTDILNLDDPTLSLYALESYAIIADNMVQNELLRKLILSHSEIARELEIANDRLAVSERKLKEAHEIAKIGRWDIDHINNKRTWSESLYHILEIDPATPPSSELFMSRVHPEDVAFAGSLYQILREKKDIWTARYRLLLPDNQVKWIFFRIQSEFEQDGSLKRSFGTVQDITTMKEAEDKLERYNKDLEAMVSAKVKEISEAQMATIFALVKLAESRDDETGAHIERTASFCRLLAEKAGALPQFSDTIDENFLTTIYRASPLHDIGKVGISDLILLKPGKLTPEEFAVMKTHVEIGYQTLKSVDKRYMNNAFIQMGRDITRYHHEKWDGSGYLAGLKGEEIPLSARIMALADVYDALRSKRVYKPAYSHEKSVEIMAEGKGKHFDPSLTDLFMEHNGEFAVLYDTLA
ncbi:MAG: HD domain-containing protein [Clostridiales bacterium]|nr:HD domain-containing protein [Clostridiales bacterium]